MKRITPHLWFDTQAKEAAEFYCSVFPDSRILNVTTLRDTPSGDCDVVSFELAGQPFMAISAGPLDPFNHAISLVVLCHTQDEIDRYWNALLRAVLRNSADGSRIGTVSPGRSSPRFSTT